MIEARCRPSTAMMLLLATVAVFVVLVLLTPHSGIDASLACTALLYRDTKGGQYTGRTMELSMELPYLLSYLPAGRTIRSAVPEQASLTFQTRYAILGIAVPNGTVEDLKVVEGLNEKGLSFSLLAFAGADGPHDNVEKTKAVLAAIDLGAWTLGLFETAQEVKSALEAQPVRLAPLALLHGARTPFHFTVHDRTGGALVIEFANGKENLVDNPVGVMTNGPELSWHLTNLNNYSFLTNMDRFEGRFGALKVRQPDSGIATQGLPSSDTSVGRFVRAAYYAQYAERVAPEAALVMLAHVMNNFDRPKGISIYDRAADGLKVDGMETEGDTTTEYTSWTALTDLNRLSMRVRTYDSMNYFTLDLADFKGVTAVKLMPLAAATRLPVDTVGAALKAAPAA